MEITSTRSDSWIKPRYSFKIVVEDFRSNLMQKMIGLVFNEAVKKMVHSFEERAYFVYSSKKTTMNSKIDINGSLGYYT